MKDLAKRVALVTGASRGIGRAVAVSLAEAGAAVAVNYREKKAEAEAVAKQIRDVGGKTMTIAADVSKTEEVARMVAAVDAELGPIDVLVNNAGVMAVPKSRTADGFEMQIGTNFLGHYALTGLLLPKISSRVVTLSSGAHRIGKIDLDDLNWQRRRYQRWAAYGQSKLADLIFAVELQRRLVAHGSAVISVAAHPGYAATELQSRTESIQDRVMSIGNRLVAQSADMGALPTLYAATSPDAVGGRYYGPDGIGELRGHPKAVGSSSATRDEALATRLWQLAEDLTGVAIL